MELAESNGLKVGDKLTLTHAKLAEYNEEYIDEIREKTAFLEVEIVGIYEINIDSEAITPTAGLPGNRIYSSLDVLSNLSECEPGIYTGEVDFYINDPKQINEINGEIQGINSINWDTHFLQTNNFQYSKIADKLITQERLFSLLIICISIVSALILTLILIMRIRGRMQEFGVLLATGKPKRDILQQVLFEMMIITVVAFLCSYFAADGVLGIIKNKLFTDYSCYLIKDSTLNLSDATKQFTDYFSLGYLKTLLVYICQLMIISISALISILAIVTLKPKEIFSKIS